MTTQLETQREFFEGEMAVLSKQKNEQIEQLQKKLNERNRERDTLVRGESSLKASFTPHR